MNTSKSSHMNVRTLTQIAMLLAIEIIMFMTPLGMLPLPGQYASLLTVPVAIGAMLIGPMAGAFLGMAFGVLSFWKAMQTGTLIAAGVGIPAILLLCIPTRILMGFFTGLIFKPVSKLDKRKTICFFAGGLLAPLLNTLFYMTAYVIILMNSPLLQAALSETMGEAIIETLRNNVVLFVAAYVGVQALIEAAVGCVTGGLVGKAIYAIGKNK